LPPPQPSAKTRWVKAKKCPRSWRWDPLHLDDPAFQRFDLAADGCELDVEAALLIGERAGIGKAALPP
jgi:hypothetical protein